MPILNIQVQQVGQVGTLPSMAYIETSDTVAEVTTVGYLNRAVESGLASFSLPCMCLVSTQVSSSVAPVAAWYILSHSNENYTLTSSAIGGGTAASKNATNVALPDVASTAGSGFVVGHAITAADAAGTIQDSGVPLGPAATRSVSNGALSTVASTPGFGFTVGHLLSSFDIHGTLADSGIAAASVGPAAAKAPTNNSLPNLASTAGSGFVVGDIVSAADTAGTLVDSGVNLQAANVSISAAQFNGMYAAPVQLIAAPGAGNLIVVHSMVLSMTYGTTPYANGSGENVYAQYGSAAEGAGFPATSKEEVSDFFTTADTLYIFTSTNGGLTSAGIPTVSAANQGLFLSVNDGTFSAGDSTFTAQILYSIISV